MVLMMFLRALADLGFYYSVAGMAFAYFGAQLVLETLLLQSACFALSFALRRSRAARVAALAPALVLVLWLAAPVDLLVSLPPLLCLACLAWTDGYRLSWERQVSLFKLSLRAFFPAACLFALLQFRLVVTVGVPAALLSAMASILLMRSLRHDEAVYLQPTYQLINSVSVLLLTLAALLLGSEWSLRTAQFLAVAFYEEAVVPLLSFVGLAIGVVFLWVPGLIRRIFDPDAVSEIPPPENLPGVEDDTLSELGRTSHAPQIFLAAAAVAVIVLVFRWMLRRWESGGRAPEVIRTDLPQNRAGKQTSGWARTYAGRIRRQYRTFLQLCLRRGVSIRPSDTSTEIGEKSLARFPDEPSLTAMRDIYQEARYHGEASREDYHTFKRLLGTLKKLPH